jgi:uncharacterized protein YfaQ (DUF2300 family)
LLIASYIARQSGAWGTRDAKLQQARRHTYMIYLESGDDAPTTTCTKQQLRIYNGTGEFGFQYIAL